MVEVVVITHVVGVLLTHGMYGKVSIRIAVVGKGTVGESGAFIQCQVAITTALEVDITADFQPVSNVGSQFHIGTDGLVFSTPNDPFITKIAYGHIVVHFLARSRDTGIIILVDTGLISAVVPVVCSCGKEVVTYQLVCLGQHTVSINTEV